MKKYSILFVILFIVLVALALKVHQNFGLNHFRNELWSDKGGYNVYLPATFIYQFDPAQFPQGLDNTMGNGYILDTLHNKVYTKYPYGVSLMQSPFWLVAHLCASDKSGYSLWHLKSVDVAAAFYLTLGCFLLFLIFRFYVRNAYAFAGSMIALLGTNVLYYGAFDPGMSHVYSFFSICLMVFSLLKLQQITTNKESKGSMLYSLLLAFSVILSIIIRPINGFILLPTLLLLGIQDKSAFIARIKLLLRPRVLLLLLMFSVVLIAPQLIYYQYLKGHIIINSYEFEGFDNVASPLFSTLLFSPNNGWLLWTPLALLLPLTMVYFFRKNLWASLLILILIAADILIYSSWWCVHLGCGFGHRPFVELIPALAVPVLLMFTKLKINKILIATLLGLLILVNLKLMFSYTGCFGGESNWDWSFYLQTLL